MPLQGVKFANMITQGDALGQELLPLQGVWGKTCETSIRNIPFGKHIVRQSFQLGERHVLHGMLYLANQLVSLVIVIIAQA